MGVAKVTLNGVTQMDVTQKTVEASKMLSGITALRNDGESITGSIASKGSSDLTASGATVTAPAGYYASSASKSVTTVTLPTATTTTKPSGTTLLTIDRNTSTRYLSIPAGYQTGGYYTISPVANGSVTAPASISGTSATVTTGTNTLTLTKTVSVTPSVTTAGYISSGTAGNSSVSLTASVTTKAATTYYPSGSDQTVAAATYVTGAQTFKAVKLTNLSAANIAEGVVVKVGDADDDDRIISITGTHGGGLEYETGTWTPSEDIEVPTISFLNAHSDAPILVMIADSTNNTVPTNSYAAVTISNYEGFVGNTLKNYYGYALLRYVNTSGSFTGSTSGFAGTATRSSWITNNGFCPSYGQSGTIWNSGRTYKWIAIWAPTT